MKESEIEAHLRFELTLCLWRIENNPKTKLYLHYLKPADVDGGFLFLPKNAPYYELGHHECLNGDLSLEENIRFWTPIVSRLPILEV